MSSTPDAPSPLDASSGSPEEPELTDLGEYARLEAPRPLDPAAHPSRIGCYRIVDVLGQGGMGTVYLAEQTEPIRRRVAIKLIRSSRHDSRHAHRFEAERQALARMSHPAIAQVYEAGDTEGGQPYLAMEHVPGVAITDYCNRERLDIDARLDLFVAVCRGIHHAHQKGILHRDIKPQNILVADDEGRPVPKIIDFGVAKVLDASSAAAPETVFGMVLGTPAYLPPESLAMSSVHSGADIDTRADVYSLGILLFELLAGDRPFGRAGESIALILRQIAEEEVPAPSAHWRTLAPAVRQTRAAARSTQDAPLARRLAGDLDWIVRRATARAREERYDSAAELAADVERHLHLQPVHAGPPGRLYVVGKFVRRYRVAVVAAGLAVLSLAAGIAARTVEARRANREASAARLAQAETQEVVDFLVDLFEVKEQGASIGGTITARELLDRGARQIRERLGEQGLTRARLLDTIGLAYRALEVSEPAEQLIREALAIREKNLAPDHPDVAASLDHLGDVLWIRAQYAEAESSLKRALAIREATLGTDDPAVADVLDHLGSVYEIQARHDEAGPVLLRALAIREKAFGPQALQVAWSLDDLGVMHLDKGDSKVAEGYLRRSLAIREARLGPNDVEVATVANGLAIALFHQERHDEGLVFHRRSLAIREKEFGADSPSVAQSLNNLANVYLELGRIDEAEAALLRAGAIWEKALGPDHPRIGIVQVNLADAYCQRGDLARAEPLYRRSLAIFEQGHGLEHPRVAYPLKGLADCLRAHGRLEESRALCARALAIREKALGPDDAETIETRAACAGSSAVRAPA